MLLQHAQSLRGKSAEKSPQSEVTPSPGMAEKGDPSAINQAINDLGNKIRQMKADHVDKVITSTSLLITQRLFFVSSLQLLLIKCPGLILLKQRHYWRTETFKNNTFVVGFDKMPKIRILY